MEILMKKHNQQGRLIVFCGLDGCGKTTMISMLFDYLKEKGKSELFLTKQPTKAVRNSQIFRTYMDMPNHDQFDYRSLSLLAASDRVQHSNRVIMEELKKGKTVISDRYFYSCLANLRARGYMADKWIYEVATFIPEPDIAFFVDVEVDTAIKRVRDRKEERDRYIDVELQHRLKDEYIGIAKNVGGTVLSSEWEVMKTFGVMKNKVENVLSLEKDDIL